jgi:hypothetical protein
MNSLIVRTFRTAEVWAEVATIIHNRKFSGCHNDNFLLQPIGAFNFGLSAVATPASHAFLLSCRQVANPAVRIYLSCHILAQSYFNMPLLLLIATKNLTGHRVRNKHHNFTTSSISTAFVWLGLLPQPRPPSIRAKHPFWPAFHDFGNNIRGPPQCLYIVTIGIHLKVPPKNASGVAEEDR